MKINLSEEQYHRLVEIVFAGTWLLNGCSKQEAAMEVYTETIQHLYSYHTEFPRAHLIEYDKKHQEFYPTTTLEQKILPFIHAYNEENFTEELIVKMLQKALGSCDSLSPCEQVRMEEVYQQELRQHGVGRLHMCREVERV